MPLEATPPRRPTLVAIVVEAWLIGGGLGTAAAMSLLSLAHAAVADAIGVFAVTAIVGGVLLSAPAAVAGGALVIAAPRWAVRWRTPICLALPALVAALGAVFLLSAGHAPAIAAVFSALAVWDAAIAAYWAHRRTLPLARAQDPAALAAVFR